MTERPMRAEKRLKLETLVEELFARNGVLETMQSQVILLLAGVTDEPHTSIRLTMADVLTNLRRAHAAAVDAGDIAEARMAARAVEYAEELTERLVNTRRYAGTKSTQ